MSAVDALTALQHFYNTDGLFSTIKVNREVSEGFRTHHIASSRAGFVCAACTKGSYEPHSTLNWYGMHVRYMCDIQCHMTSHHCKKKPTHTYYIQEEGGEGKKGDEKLCVEPRLVHQEGDTPFFAASTLEKVVLVSINRHTNTHTTFSTHHNISPTNPTHPLRAMPPRSPFPSPRPPSLPFPPYQPLLP